ncbi:ABC transporter permease [Wenyingzhuangia marina]|uniref:Putative ABC transport system permease protein n=1 Tax=Wenyingzhuangia marina TaxID=1195760 RepID=A0A1M5W7R1_9FLAO|nr:ABC transporter permease [Wenyingzhuangia marina]GGF75413.1 ABC transporter ATP-binding protein [Wenyingzhuangia marina]SHH83233.1 putative ABC transport system permease protein [Wenyingzhuangia marina]
MKFLFEKDTWQEIYESVRKNKMRTFITVIGVTWGIFLLVALLGCARGMENSFKRLFGDFATNSVFIWGGSTEKAFHGFQEGKRILLNLNDVENIKKEVDGIEFVVPRNSRNGTLIRNFQTGDYTINGDFPVLDKVQKKNLIIGRFINQSDIDKKRKVIVLSEDIYKQFFKEKENPIGENIELNKINFIVVGVFKNGNVGMSSDIHIPFTTFQQIYNSGQKIGMMMVTGKADSDIKQVELDTKLLIKNLHDIHPDDQRAIGGFNLGKEFERVNGFLTGMQFLTWFVGIATLIAGVFAIGNILLITVKERTKEIGIRRAIGATPLMIKRQIILEAVTLALVAGFLGIIGGGLVLIFIDKIWGQGADAVLVNSSVSIPIILVAIGILALLGTLIGLIPATKATQVNPIEALNS